MARLSLRPRPRARRLGASIVLPLLALALAACTTPVQPNNPKVPGPVKPPTGGSGKVVDLGRKLTDYIKLPGDQVVVVRNGTYTAGDVNAPHPATGGPYKGWLVLKAESKHGVVVDLGGAPLTLNSGTSRVLFVGFRFVNGPMFVNGSDIAFWHTDHSYPADVWAKQGRRHSSADTVHAYSRSTRNVGFFGSDLHDTGDALDVSNSTGTRIEGVKIWNLSDMGVDPQDRIHPDAIDGVTGNINNFTVRDSYIKGRVILKDWAINKGGPSYNIRFERTWISHSPSSGFIFTSGKPSSPRGLFGAMVDVRTWANNNGKARIDIVDGRQYYQANVFTSRVNITVHGLNTQAPPAGMASPADTWRAAHPYDGWMYALQ
jgi:hypothetical protein